MTLFQQINSLLFGLFLLVMSSLVYFQFTETQKFMYSQMESDLNNTSTSLSLMLTPYVKTGDMVAAETLVNVIFEGGFYKKISLTWLEDHQKQEWVNPIVVESVPQWFLNLDLFKPQVTETVITSGWLQLATLKIEGNPAIGYRELWRIMNDTLLILSLLFIVSIFLVLFRLKQLLKPLNEIAAHARKIAKRQFDKDLKEPETSELRDVVCAMNMMSGQLKHVFITLDNEVDSLRTETLIDQVSQLPNRQYLNTHLTSWLNEPGYGGLIIAKLEWLNDIDSKFGYQVRDNVIKVLAVTMQKQLLPIADALIARISNIEFAFLITKGEKEEITSFLQCLIRLINQEMHKAGCMPNENFAIGVSERTADMLDMKPSQLLAQADNAQNSAMSNNKISEWFKTNSKQKYSREEWRKRLTSAIEDHQFVFQWQSVFSMKTGSIIQREIFCRIRIDEQLVQAKEFIPYVELLSLGSQLDKYLLETIIAKDVLLINPEPVAINLSFDSVIDQEFHLWLTNFLEQLQNKDKICFEISEKSINSSKENSLALCSIIRHAGFKLGIDHCGSQMGSLNYLQQFKPSYVKLDQSLAFYSLDKDSSDPQNNELCRALVNIAKGFEIDVIMTAVENQDQLKLLQSFRAEGYQGYISSPSDIK